MNDFLKKMTLAVSGVVALVVCQAVVSVQTGPGGIDGYVTDADGGVLPGVTVLVSSAGGASETKMYTNPRGRFAVTQLTPGQYQLQLSLPGFKTARGAINVRLGAISAVTFQMSVGSLEELVTVRSPSTIPAPPAPTVPAPEPGVVAPIRVGGSIQEPRKIRDVKPVFPPEAVAAGAEGEVRIEAVIGRDGGVAEARVLQGVPLLNAAALEAVRQWRYTPTRLNGAPIEVIANVTVRFVR